MKRFLSWLKRILTGYEEIPCPRGESFKCSLFKGIPLKCGCRHELFKNKIESHKELINRNRGKL